MERKHEVVDEGLVNHAIHEVLGVFASEGLTVAESIKVAVAVDRALKAKYPEAYDILAGKAYDELRAYPLPTDA